MIGENSETIREQDGIQASLCTLYFFPLMYIVPRSHYDAESAKNLIDCLVCNWPVQGPILESLQIKQTKSTTGEHDQTGTIIDEMDSWEKSQQLSDLISPQAEWGLPELRRLGEYSHGVAKTGAEAQPASSF